jgi:hypothetical protein
MMNAHAEEFRHKRLLACGRVLQPRAIQEPRDIKPIAEKSSILLDFFGAPPAGLEATTR